MTSPVIPNALTIAGTDPSGGAGIQADLKAFSALGAFGTAVITALVAQNTRGVAAVQEVPADFVTRQIDVLLDDVRIDAVKIGMVANAGIATAVADRLAARVTAPIVVDPVMVAKSGDPLLSEDAVAALRGRLVPLATVITPNLPEAGVLLDRPAPTTIDAMADAGRDLLRLGPKAVLIKGGHLAGADSPDLLVTEERVVVLPARRIATANTHGTGCTLSAAIAALLPQSADPEAAIRGAKDYLTDALAAADTLSVGGGHGPVHHFHALWQRKERAA